MSKLRRALIFYERHSDMTPTKAIDALALNLPKGSSVSHFAIEDPVDLEPLIGLKMHEDTKEALKEALSEGSNKDKIELLKNFGIMVFEESHIEEGIKIAFRKLENEFESLSILKRAIDKLQCKPFNMDMPNEEGVNKHYGGVNERDKFMSYQIDQEVPEGGSVIILVGASHSNITNLLQQSGFAVTEVGFPLSVDHSDIHLENQKAGVESLGDRMKSGSPKSIFIENDRALNEFFGKATSFLANSDTEAGIDALVSNVEKQITEGPASDAQYLLDTELMGINTENTEN